MLRLLGTKVGAPRPRAALALARQLRSSVTAPSRSLHMSAGLALNTRLASPTLCKTMRVGSARCLPTQSSGIGPMNAARLRLFGAQRRAFCTAPPSSHIDTAKQSWLWLQHNKALVGVAAGAVLVLFGFYRISIRVMSFFLHVPPQQIFTAGMIVGAVTTVRFYH